MNLDERDLIELLRRDGDRSAFRQLYAEHTPVLFRIASRVLLEPADAEDAVHDTWLRAVQGIARFRGASSFRTWITGILINRARELSRAPTHIAFDSIPEPTATEVQSLPHGIDAHDLREALNALPHGFREILVLHDIEGYKHEEISLLLGIAAGTSKSQLSRARVSLRELLSDTRSKT